MWLFQPLTGEHVVTGDNASLHLSQTGLAYRPVKKRAEKAGELVADYSQVTRVSVHGWRRATLRLELADGKGPWQVKGLPKPHGQWARHTIEEYMRFASWTAEDAMRSPMDFAEIAGYIGQHSDDLPLLGNFLVRQAINHRANDMELEPRRDGYAFRLRIDGVIFDVGTIPADTAGRLLRMFKNQARLKSYRTATTQEGRITLTGIDGPVDLRVTVMPGIGGEKLSIRVLNPAAQLFDLGRLGLTDEQNRQVQELIHQPTGAVVFCGPGGSGKTTSIYAALQELRQGTGGRSLATIEEPVEFDLDGVSQTQVTEGLDFAKALSVILRQDPGVVMVGEIRDPQTAEIAMRAGMTGQLLLTTMHSASAELVIPRLLDFGVEPYMVASALSAIISQRLVRTLCDACAKEYEPTTGDLEALGVSRDAFEGATLKMGQGCEKCHGTGYHGRTGIFDIVTVDDELSRLVMQQDIAVIRQRLSGPGLMQSAVQ
ncbi:MAG: GspE/PulE family protein, partial [Armatimonadota bacterium]